MMRSTAPENTESDRAEVVAFRSPSGAPVEVMRTWYRTQSFPRHTHEYFTVGVMLSGIGTLWSRGTTHTLRRGDVVIIPPGEVHTGGLGGTDDVLSYLAMHVPDDVVSLCASTYDAPPPAVHASHALAIRDRAIATELRRLDNAMDGRIDRRAADDAVTRTIDLVVGRLLRQHAGDDNRSARSQPGFVQRVQTIIEDCYADGTRMSLLSLAAEAGVTPFHLVRAFTRAVGLSPHRYVTQTRVRRARALLAAGMSPSFVAASTGFVDQSHLTTQFRRYVGTTPAAYQRARGGADRSIVSRSD
jgi:AraC-like DNA-binding protein/quercetin dioxygenase-like cupin family protein